MIRDADPTAKLIGPNVLNWDVTCQSCPGVFDLGRGWVDSFRAAYQKLENTEPPIDVWGIETADLNWDALPMVNWHSLGDQLANLRAYLELLPAHRGKPIWVTEFAIVWGYEGVEWSQQADNTWRAYPSGQYRGDLIAAALQGYLGWLEANADRLASTAGCCMELSAARSVHGRVRGDAAAEHPRRAGHGAGQRRARCDPADPQRRRGRPDRPSPWPRRFANSTTATTARASLAERSARRRRWRACRSSTSRRVASRTSAAAAAIRTGRCSTACWSTSCSRRGLRCPLAATSRRSATLG